MVFLDRELINTHKTYESILSLPDVPLITRGKQGKKNEDRLAFIETLNKSEIILEHSSFPNGFDPLKEKEDFSSFGFIALLELLSAYHHFAKKETAIFDAGLYNRNIHRIVEALKKEAKSLIDDEDDEDVWTYAFIDVGLMNTPMVMDAFELALEHFKEKKDIDDLPYIYRLIRIASKCDDEASVASSFLYDMDDEKGQISKEKEFPKEVFEAVELLKERKDIPYLRYIKDISNNPIATKVKIGDLLENLNKRRNNNKHLPMSLYYFKGLSLLEKEISAIESESFYFYYQDEDVFIKKTEHGHFALDEGCFVHSPYRITEEVFDLTFYQNDECLKEDALPFFIDGKTRL